MLCGPHGVFARGWIRNVVEAAVRGDLRHVRHEDAAVEGRGLGRRRPGSTIPEPRGGGEA